MLAVVPASLSCAVPVPVVTTLRPLPMPAITPDPEPVKSAVSVCPAAVFGRKKGGDVAAAERKAVHRLAGRHGGIAVQLKGCRRRGSSRPGRGHLLELFTVCRGCAATGRAGVGIRTRKALKPVPLQTSSGRPGRKLPKWTDRVKLAMVAVGSIDGPRDRATIRGALPDTGSGLLSQCRAVRQDGVCATHARPETTHPECAGKRLR